MQTILPLYQPSIIVRVVNISYLAQEKDTTVRVTVLMPINMKICVQAGQKHGASQASLLLHSIPLYSTAAIRQKIFSISNEMTVKPTSICQRVIKSCPGKALLRAWTGVGHMSTAIIFITVKTSIACLSIFPNNFRMEVNKKVVWKLYPKFSDDLFIALRKN